MTASSVFFDTAPLIYLIENHPDFVAPVAQFVSDALDNQATLLTSVISYSEFGVMPERLGRREFLTDLDEFLRQFNVTMLDVNRPIATTAYQLRAKYAFLRGMDALQLATAITHRADTFLTNDRKLKAVQEVKVVLVAEL